METALIRRNSVAMVNEWWTASEDKSTLWDAPRQANLGAIKHESAVNSAQFQSDGQWIVTASDDKTARLWDAATGKQSASP